MIKDVLHRIAGLRKTRRGAIATASFGAVALALVASLSPFSPGATAAVVKNPAHGYQATVMGYSGWFGPYFAANVGNAFCIDHAVSPAPNDDPNLTNYGPISANFLSADNQRRMAWLMGQHANPFSYLQPNRVELAAVELVLHDFRGASYPQGTMNVSNLQASQMAGFPGDDAAKIAYVAKVFKYEAVLYSAITANPIVHDLNVSSREPGTRGEVTGRLSGPTANGRLGLGNWPINFEASGIALDAAQVTTAEDGTFRMGYRVDDGEPNVNLKAITLVPDVNKGLSVFGAPQGGQRVATGNVAAAEASLNFQVESQRFLKVKKTSDNPGVSVAGIKFDVKKADGGNVGTLTVGEGGSTNAVDVDPGVYYLQEQANDKFEPLTAASIVGSQPGVSFEQFQGLPSVKVDMTNAAPNSTKEVVLTNVAKPGTGSFNKVDYDKPSQSVVGAKFKLEYDADNNGSYETSIISEFTTDGSIKKFENLKAGKYLLTETFRPANYAPEPGHEDGKYPFVINPGQTTEIVAKNVPLATVQFIKYPQGEYNEDAFTLAGAVFEVSTADGTKVAECTTTQVNLAADLTLDDGTVIPAGTPTGQCGLPENKLDAGTDYCWEETTVPPGWEPAEGACFTAGTEGAGDVTVIPVKEVSQYTKILGNKFDVDTQAKLAGGVFDLYRKNEIVEGTTVTPCGEGQEVECGPAPEAPADAEVRPGFTWVGRATSDASGKVDWPTQLPGYIYCSLEKTAPTGYEADTTFRCLDVALAKGTPATIDLPNKLIPIVGGVQVTAPQVQEAVLARTGGAIALLSGLGTALFLSGRSLLAASRSRRLGRKRGYKY